MVSCVCQSLLSYFLLIVLLCCVLDWEQFGDCAVWKNTNDWFQQNNPFLGAVNWSSHTILFSFMWRIWRKKGPLQSVTSYSMINQNLSAYASMFWKADTCFSRQHRSKYAHGVVFTWLFHTLRDFHCTMWTLLFFSIFKSISVKGVGWTNHFACH